MPVEWISSGDPFYIPPVRGAQRSGNFRLPFSTFLSYTGNVKKMASKSGPAQRVTPAIDLRGGEDWEAVMSLGEGYLISASGDRCGDFRSLGDVLLRLLHGSLLRRHFHWSLVRRFLGSGLLRNTLLCHGWLLRLLRRMERRPTFLRGFTNLCTRPPSAAFGRALKEALLAAVQEAYAIGFLAGQEMRLRESTCPGSADRPPWMDIRLDDPAALATHHLRLRPIVLRSLLDAGYQCLGDLRWVPIQQLVGLFYIGRKTAKQIRATVERLERDA